MRKIFGLLLVGILAFSVQAEAVQKYQEVVTNFTGGVISPKLYGRVDLQKYYNSVAEMENFYVQPYGGAFKRPGTNYVGTTKYSDKETRLLNFTFSNDDAYILEMGDQYIRFYRNQELLYADANPLLDDEYLSLLSAFEATDGDVEYTAESGQDLIFEGDAQIDTAQFKFGTSSLLLDGTDDYVYAVDSEEYSFTTNDFTIDTWIRAVDFSAIRTVCGSGQSGCIVRFESNTSLKVYSDWATAYTFTISALSNATWYHLAVVREDDDLSVYIDGVQQGASQTVTDKSFNFNGEMQIGTYDYGTAPFNGWIDEFRLSKGIARWTANFTPPTLSYSSADAWVTATAYVVDDYVEQASITYKCLIAHTSGTFSTDLTAGYWTDEEIYEIKTPFLEADVFEIQYTQSADIMYFAHNGYPPMELSRRGNTDWELKEMEFKYGPFMELNDDEDFTIAPSAQGIFDKNITLVASRPYFEDEMIGSYMSIGGLYDGEQGYVKITSVTDSKNATARVESILATDSAVDNWAEGSFSEINGYPAAVDFYEQRLFWGGTDEEPQTVWSSKTSLYYNYQSGTEGDAALTYELFSKDVNQIVWIDGESKALVIGTSGGPFTLWSGTGNEPLTPNMVSAKKSSSFGCANIRPVRIDSNLYYIQRGFTKLRELVYSFEQDGYLSQDATIMSDEILNTSATSDYTVTDIAYQRLPVPLVWCVKSSGDIAILTIENQQDIKAWSEITFRTPIKAKSIAILPNGSVDQAWIILENTVDGATTQSVCYFESFASSQVSANLYGDLSTVQEFDTAITGVYTVTGLDYLDGQFVTIRGYVTGEMFLSGQKRFLKFGQISDGELVIDCGDTEYSKLYIGRSYASYIKLLPPQFKGDISATHGHKARVYAIFAETYRSNKIKFRMTRSIYNETTPLEQTQEGIDFLFNYKFTAESGNPLYPEGTYAYKYETDFGFGQQKYFEFPMSGWSRTPIVYIVGTEQDDKTYTEALNILTLTLYVAFGG